MPRGCSIYEFPRLAELPWWQKLPRYRQPKFTGNMSSPEYLTARKFTAQLYARQTGLEPQAFPICVAASTLSGRGARLHPGRRRFRPGGTPRIQMLERFEFASIDEVKK